MKQIKRILPLTLALITLLVNNIYSQQATPVIKKGIWLGVITRKDGKEIPFNFLSTQKEGKQLVTIINASDRLEVTEIETKDDSLLIKLPFFASSLIVKQTSPTLLKGYYIKDYVTRKQIIPFAASFGVKQRFAITQKATHNISGTWDVLFIGKDNDSTKAVGNFTQSKNGKVTGSFLTPSGDYRYLEGAISGDTLKLSGFDGGFANLFTAIIKDNSTLTNADFYTGAMGHERWTAIKNPNASLPDEYGHSHLKMGESKLDFKFKDTKGQWVSINDEQFKNKVIIIQILGSWCPNCMDETGFLSDYYKKNKQKGIEIIGLAYERTEDFAISQKALATFQNRFAVEYPFLITGVTASDPQRTEKTLPQIDHIDAFPTTFFIDKKGVVRKIHTGYDGPGTGKFYDAFKKEFNELVTSLVEEKD
jgi:peroxiredoxin